VYNAYIIAHIFKILGQGVATEFLVLLYHATLSQYIRIHHARILPVYVLTSASWAFNSVATDASTMVEIRRVTSHQQRVHTWF
jgi:hypothetical protein